MNNGLNAALKETDREKRRAGFTNVLEHLDPGNELARQKLDRLVKA